MKICFFNRSYFPDTGATGQLLTELAEDLTRNFKCRVCVVTGPALRGKGTGQQRIRGWLPAQKEIMNGVEVFRARGTTFNPQRFLGRVTNYMSFFLSACLTGFMVPRPDIVISLTDPPIIGLAALWTARRSGARFVFLCQDVFPEVARLLEDFQSETVYRTLDRIGRLLNRRAERVIAVGETM